MRENTFGITTTQHSPSEVASMNKKKGAREGPLVNALFLIATMLSHHGMWVQHEFLRRSFVKILIALRRILQGDDLDVHGLRDLYLFIKDRLHQLAMVFHHRTLACKERM